MVKAVHAKAGQRAVLAALRRSAATVRARALPRCARLHRERSFCVAAEKAWVGRVEPAVHCQERAHAQREERHVHVASGQPDARDVGEVPSERAVHSEDDGERAEL